MARKKKEGWELGQGPYSRSHPKLNPDKLLSKHEPTFPAIKGFNALSGNPGAKFTGRDWTKQFKDISNAVEKNSAAGKFDEPSLPGGPGGFSGRVSKGTRPKHKQGSWKRV